MHFDLPKPLHGWRAFVGELGIIVLGVLLALSAGQLVEYFNDRAELRAAEDAMTSELRDDNLPQAFTRAAIDDCYSRQLDALDGAVASGDRTKFLTLARAYSPVYRTWDDQAWKAALASQVLVQSGSKRIFDWSTSYVVIALADQTAKAELDELPQLWANLSGEGPISMVQQDRLFQVISVLRFYNRRMSVFSLIFMDFVGRQRGLTLTPKAKQALLAKARQTYGACVNEPPGCLTQTTSFPMLRREFRERTKLGLDVAAAHCRSEMSLSTHCRPATFRRLVQLLGGDRAICTAFRINK